MIIIFVGGALGARLEAWEFSSAHNATAFMNDIHRCLQTDVDYLPTNTTEALDHYQFLLNFTRPMRRTRRIPYRTCSGPFLEEEFIRRYLNRPLSFFSPFIPLFVPWFAHFKSVDAYYYPGFARQVTQQLRPDYLYLTIAESDFGLSGTQISYQPPPANILILSPSGQGHIAVPWLQCNHLAAKKTKTHFLSFCGNPRSSRTRKVILEAARSVFGRDMFEYRGDDWEGVSQESLFGFAPRGLAVGTYRTFELIRMETIPIVATDDLLWLPYYPGLDWTKFAILTTAAELPRAAARVRAMRPEEIEEMHAELHRVSVEFFQWDAFFKRFEAFLRGEGRSYFACSKATLTFDTPVS
jgi:hypothetical protein